VPRIGDERRHEPGQGGVHPAYNTEVSSRTLALVGIGLVAGFFSGVLGVGGGILVVPLLIGLVAYEPKPAMAASLAAILFTSAAAGASHAQAGHVAWADAAFVGLPAVGGAILGAWLHQRIEARRVVLGFSLFLLAAAVKLAL
jgi:uncharacterized membrane protein YfcA